MRPDFGPQSLRFFLSTQARFAGCDTALAGEFACAKCRRTWRANLRRKARVTKADLERARRGRLLHAAPRRRLWCALGFNPAGHGIRLVNGGKQERNPDA